MELPASSQSGPPNAQTAADEVIPAFEGGQQRAGLVDLKDASPAGLLDTQSRGNHVDFSEREASDNETQASSFIQSLCEEILGNTDRSCNKAPVSESSQSVPMDFDLSLRAAQHSLADETPKLPWEDPFWGSFFGTVNPLDVILPPVPKTRPRPPFLSQEEGSLSTRDPVKRIRTVGPITRRWLRTGRSFLGKRSVRLSTKEAFASGANCLDASLDSRVLEMRSLANQEERVGVIADFVSRKAPATILKRAYSLLRLTAMAKARGLGFPLPEHEVYAILNDAKAGGAAFPGQVDNGGPDFCKTYL